MSLISLGNLVSYMNGFKTKIQETFSPKIHNHSDIVDQIVSVNSNIYNAKSAVEDIKRRIIEIDVTALNETAATNVNYTESLLQKIRPHINHIHEKDMYEYDENIETTYCNELQSFTLSTNSINAGVGAVIDIYSILFVADSILPINANSAPSILIDDTSIISIDEVSNNGKKLVALQKGTANITFLDATNSNKVVTFVIS